MAKSAYETGKKYMQNQLAEASITITHDRETVRHAMWQSNTYKTTRAQNDYVDAAMVVFDNAVMANQKATETVIIIEEQPVEEKATDSVARVEAYRNMLQGISTTALLYLCREAEITVAETDTKQAVIATLCIDLVANDPYLKTGRYAAGWAS